MGSRRSRRVSWATGPSLCKVRLFISEDSPSQAGLRPQDNLQAKGSTSLMHAAGPSSDDSLPPGFESLQPANDLKIDISQIPLIMWKCPPHILLNPDWQLASGQESREIPVQNERMFGVLEAIYPRASNIPPNPFVSLDVKDAHYDDSGTPLVPVIPVEDDDASDQSEGPMVDPPNDAPQVSNAPITAAQQHPHGSTGVEPDVLAAASAAYTAIMQSNQKGSMVDRDLLVKILSDPVQVERLMKEYNQIRQKQSTSSSVVAPMPSGPPPQMTMSAPASYSNHITTFQNTNSALPPPLQMAPRPMMNRLPQGYPPVPMNHPPGSSPAINLRPGSSPAMSRPPGPNLAMSRPPGLNPAMSRPPGPNPAMSHPPGPNPAMSHPPGSNPATGHPPGSNPAMSHPSGSNPAMSHPPGSNLATSYPPGSSSPAMNFSGAPPRAINYYKTLIHQHGGERQESLEQHGRQFGMYPQSAPPQTSGIDAVNGASVTNRDMKTRPTRPCAYFNGPRGCRNGANCTFLHDSSASSRQQEQQNGSKRLKLDSGIAGRN